MTYMSKMVHAMRKFGYAGTKGVIKGAKSSACAGSGKGYIARGETNLNDDFCMLPKQGLKRRLTNYG